MTFIHFLTVVRARWRAVLLVWGTVLAVVLAVTLLLPKRYTASGSVLVDIKTPDPVTGVAQSSANITNSSVMATQMDVMQSERVILRALKALNWTQSEQFREKWKSITGEEGYFESWLVESVQKQLEIRPARESSVMNVAYTAPHPQLAADMVNAIVRAYIDTTLELKVAPAQQYNLFFESRSKELRAALEAAQSKLSAYQQNKGLLATDERLDVENTRLTELVSGLVALQGVASESGSRVQQAKADGNLQEILSSPMVTSLSLEVSRQEAKLRETNERLGPNHPLVMELQATLSVVRRQLASEKSRASASVGVNNQVIQERLNQMTHAVQAQRAKVLALKSQRDEAAVFLRDVQSAQRSYDAVLARASQAELESRNTGTNVVELKTATPPFASSPNMGMNLGVAAVLGGLLALIVAFWRERFDPRLRCTADVVEGLLQELLVVMPSSSAQTQQGRSRLQLAKTRVVAGLPPPESLRVPA